MLQILPWMSAKWTLTFEKTKCEAEMVARIWTILNQEGKEKGVDVIFDRQKSQSGISLIKYPLNIQQVKLVNFNKTFIIIWNLCIIKDLDRFCIGENLKWGIEKLEKKE